MKKPKGSEEKKPRTIRAKDKIFAVASDLFYREGIRAVGVDTIVKAAGVTKISLYRSFASKDDLIVSYLEDRSARFLAHWDEMFEPLASDPRAQLRAIMVYLTERTTSEGYLGCPFINYCAEFRDPGGPGRRVAQATKTALRQRFVIIASALKVEEPRFLADSLLLLLEGAYALSQTLGVGEDSPAHSLVQAAEALVASQEIGS